LAIGTIQGKYHSSALKIGGLSVDDYLQARDKFIKIHESNKLSATSDQEASVIIMQNQKDVFNETDLI
jgi:hypothetical protein